MIGISEKTLLPDNQILCYYCGCSKDVYYSGFDEKKRNPIVFFGYVPNGRLSFNKIYSYLGRIKRCGLSAIKKYKKRCKKYQKICFSEIINYEYIFGET